MLLDVLGGVHDLLAPPIPKERKEIGKKRKKENTYSELFFIWLFGFNGWLLNLQDPSVCYKKKKKKKPLPFDDYDLPKSHFSFVCHRQGTAPDEAYMISAFGGSG